MNSFDVIVIGVGGWGSAALWHLARRGRKVCGIEQFQIGHDRGSSHGESRIIRMAYFAHPDYVPLLGRAYALWREVEGESGSELMTLTGLLCIGEPDGALIRGLEECYAAHQIEHERLTPGESMRRHPAFTLPDHVACYWDPHGGFLRPEACIRAHVSGAIRAGATLSEGETVLNIRPSGEGVEVTTTKRTLLAQKVIVTIGAYANRLLTSVGVSVQPTRKVLFWYEVEDPQAFAQERFPCWIARLHERNFYGFPTLDGASIKAAEDTGGQPLNDALQEVDPELRQEDEAHLRPFLEQVLVSRLGARLRHKTCLYEKSADGHFIIDAHPEHENIIFAAGGSGHGFKFSSAIGELTANFATGAIAQPPELFRLARLIQTAR